MSLQALKIVEEEVASAQERNDPLNEQAVSHILDTVEARIKKRIQEECVEILKESVTASQSRFCDDPECPCHTLAWVPENHRRGIRLARRQRS